MTARVREYTIERRKLIHRKAYDEFHPSALPAANRKRQPRTIKKSEDSTEPSPSFINEGCNRLFPSSSVDTATPEETAFLLLMREPVNTSTELDIRGGSTDRCKGWAQQPPLLVRTQSGENPTRWRHRRGHSRLWGGSCCFSRPACMRQARFISLLLLRESIIVNDSELALNAVRAGLGRSLLPSRIGDKVSGLSRLSDARPVLSREMWLIVHPDLKNLARVRAGIAWIERLMSDRPS
jgi:hypothetical protein